MYTTLRKIRACSPCPSGWTMLLGNLGKTKADDEPLLITTILDSNGVDDALWCLRAVDGHQREMRLFAVDCARSVQHLTNNPRSIAAIDTAERHAYGLATNEELAAAWGAVWTVARDAAWEAAWAAAREAVWEAAWGSAAVEAVWEAAREAAWAAAREAVREAAREVQADLLRIVCAEIEQREGT